MKKRVLYIILFLCLLIPITKVKADNSCGIPSLTMYHYPDSNNWPGVTYSKATEDVPLTIYYGTSGTSTTLYAYCLDPDLRGPNEQGIAYYDCNKVSGQDSQYIRGLLYMMANGYPSKVIVPGNENASQRSTQIALRYWEAYMFPYFDGNIFGNSTKWPNTDSGFGPYKDTAYILTCDNSLQTYYPNNNFYCSSNSYASGLFKSTTSDGQTVLDTAKNLFINTVKNSKTYSNPEAPTIGDVKITAQTINKDSIETLGSGNNIKYKYTIPISVTGANISELKLSNIPLDADYSFNGSNLILTIKKTDENLTDICTTDGSAANIQATFTVTRSVSGIGSLMEWTKVENGEQLQRMLTYATESSTVKKDVEASIILPCPINCDPKINGTLSNSCSSSNIWKIDGPDNVEDLQYCPNDEYLYSNTGSCKTYCKSDYVITLPARGTATSGKKLYLESNIKTTRTCYSVGTGCDRVDKIDDYDDIAINFKYDDIRYWRHFALPSPAFAQKENSSNYGTLISSNGQTSVYTFDTTFNPVEFYSRVENGEATATKLSTNFTSIGNNFPISLTTPKGTYNYSILFTKFTDDKTTELIKNTTYSCTYDVKNNDLLDHHNDGGVDKITKKYFGRVVTLNDLFPNSNTSVNGHSYVSGRAIGANWSNVKGQKTEQIIEEKGEKAYETPEYSYTLTPTQMQAIRSYNSDKDDKGGYTNPSLLCEDDGINCKSEFLNHNGTYFTENKRNTEWTTWDSSNTNYEPCENCGPAWK